MTSNSVALLSFRLTLNTFNALIHCSIAPTQTDLPKVNLLMLNFSNFFAFSKFTTFSRFNSFNDYSALSDAIILHEIFFFCQNHILRIKNKTVL